MYQPIHATTHHPEQQLSTVRLSAAEEAGLSPQRSHLPPQGLLLGWRRFLDSSQPSGPSRPIVAPSARRAAPLRSVA